MTKQLTQRKHYLHLCCIIIGAIVLFYLYPSLWHAGTNELVNKNPIRVRSGDNPDDIKGKDNIVAAKIRSEETGTLLPLTPNAGAANTSASNIDDGTDALPVALQRQNVVKEQHNTSASNIDGSTDPLYANLQQQQKVEHEHPSKAENPDLTVVTGFSDNHLLEGINMLKSLIKVNYTDPIYVYYLYRPGEEYSNKYRKLARAINKSPLRAIVINFEVVDSYKTYCFKPSIVGDFLRRAQSASATPSVLFWADASIRFTSNPSLHAANMILDDVDFAGKKGTMGMVESTHEDTFRYLNLSKDDFKQYTEIAATLFMVNLLNQDVITNILQPWIDCGVMACHSCMAPPGSSKALSGPIKRAPSTIYIGHRQDQSVLSLLTYDFFVYKQDNNGIAESAMTGTDIISAIPALNLNRKYIPFGIRRNDRAENVFSLNE